MHVYFTLMAYWLKDGAVGFLDTTLESTFQVLSNEDYQETRSNLVEKSKRTLTDQGYSVEGASFSLQQLSYLGYKPVRMGGGK